MSTSLSAKSFVRSSTSRVSVACCSKTAATWDLPFTSPSTHSHSCRVDLVNVCFMVPGTPFSTGTSKSRHKYLVDKFKQQLAFTIKKLLGKSYKLNFPFLSSLHSEPLRWFAGFDEPDPIHRYLEYNSQSNFIQVDADILDSSHNSSIFQQLHVIEEFMHFWLVEIQRKRLKEMAPFLNRHNIN
ncbi:hypothetical protein KY285_036268 [Solanum tuberosum]|nr:hypothetical protein KY285_036268 [Solanum tuberosum]